LDALRREEYYSYENWLALDDDIRTELLDGMLHLMAPPSTRHQIILGRLYGQLINFLRGKKCQVIPAPFGVRLFNDEDTAFQPDITVVCDPSKLNEKGCEGAPDFVIEILSPSTARYDKLAKFNEYLRAGVLEYWIVDPDDNTIAAYRLKNGEYIAKMYSDSDICKPQTLPGCEIDLAYVFEDHEIR